MIYIYLKKEPVIAGSSIKFSVHWRDDYNPVFVSEIKLVDLPSTHRKYQAELEEAAIKVIRNGQYIGGEALRSFESALSQHVNASVIGVGNGTDALLVALMALGIGPGDEVIVPAFTYAASAEVILLLRAIPVWCDVHPDDFNINTDSLRGLNGPAVKAIIVVHLFGQCADLEGVMAVLPGVPIVEDCAQSLGAKWTSGLFSGKMAGTAGDLGTFSFFPTKPLGGLGDGGAICSRDEELIERAHQIASHGQSQKYHHAVVGLNSRLDSIQAAMLEVKLKHFENSARERQKNAAFYNQELAHLSEVTLPKTTKHSTHVYHQYTLQIHNGKRQELIDFLRKQRIQSMVYYPMPLHAQPAYAHIEKKVSLAQSEKLCNEVLSIPVHEELSESDLLHIVSSIKSFYQRNE